MRWGYIIVVFSLLGILVLAFGNFNFINRIAGEEMLTGLLPQKNNTGDVLKSLDMLNQNKASRTTSLSSEEQNTWKYHASTYPSDVNPRIKEAAKEITKDSSSSYEDVELIYEWITRNIAYDVEKYNKGEPYVPDVLETFKSRKGICGDYALLTHEMIVAVGGKAEIKSGNVFTDRGMERHAWNEVFIDGELFALDTTWGAGFLDSEGEHFIHSPNPIFFTGAEELERLHSSAEYRESKFRNWMRENSLKASPEFIFSSENNIIRFLNQAREEKEYLNPLHECSELQKEARRLAVEISEKECSGETWSLELETVTEKLDSSLGISTLVGQVYCYWGYMPLNREDVLQGWTDDVKLREVIFSPGYNAIGAAVVQRGDLFVVVKLLSS